jgi:NitT/TauT family transport system permease protein
LAADADSPRFTRIAAPALVGIAMLLAWHALVTVLGVPKYLVPSPVDVAQTLVADWGLLSAALLVTLRITFFAFLCATVIGTLVAFAFVQSRLVEASFFPYAILLQVTPIVAIAPLVIIWVENIQVALVLCATIVAIFPIISNTTLGLRSVNRGLADLFRMNGATRLQTLVRLRIPSAAPYFFGGLRISSGLALIGAVVAEFVAGTGGHGAGLAYQILQAGFQLNIPRLFAALFLITVAGVLLYLAMVWLTRLALGHWHESELASES